MSNLKDCLTINIYDSNGIDRKLNFSDYITTQKLNWSSFCSKIEIRQKRYGEAGVAILNFVLVSSYGNIGGAKNSVLKCPIELGDKIEIIMSGKLDLAAFINNGESSVNTISGKKKIYVGYVFDLKINHIGEVTITCYDLLRYLKNQKCFFSYKAGDIAIQIINEALKSLNLGKGENDIKLKLDTALFSNYKVNTTGKQEEFFNYDKNFIDLVNWLLNRCLMAGFNNAAIGFSTYMLFMVDYDNNQINIGTADKLGRISPYIVSSKSLMTNCELSESIESDVFNSVYAGIDYISPENHQGARWWGLSVEKNSLEQFGSLCHYEKFSQNDFLKEDTSLTIDILKKVMEAMVKLKCKPKVKLNIKSMGNPFIQAGMLVPIQLPNSMMAGILTKIDQTSAMGVSIPIVLIDEITHTIQGNQMEMSFTSSVLLENYTKWANASTTEIK